VRVRTVSEQQQPDAHAQDFAALHTYLAQSFPRLHASLRRETVATHSLLYTWPGSDPSLPAVVLMAHQDVVPIAPGTERDWQVEPFSGEIRDGFVWGRGAWDDKGNLMSQLEAVEALVAAGFAPRRTILLAFGHDEEVGGSGAKAIAELLATRGTRVEFVVDEGMLITEGMLKGLDPPAALVGLAEKGYVTVELTASATPGHSSMPSRRTAIGTLAGALARLSDTPMPARLTPLARDMLETLAPEMGGANRVLLSNLWLTGGLVVREFAKSPSTDATLRTTTAPTIVAGGNKENVLPGEARALVNFRILPGDTSQDVLAHVRRVVADEGVRIVAVGEVHEPSRVSRIDTPAYRTLSSAIRALDPAIVVAPGLMIGATDSRYFERLTDNVYRFSPVRVRAEDLSRFHGTNERIAIRNYGEMITFYHRLLSVAAGP
jgi:carboxypeptidase PM20D1